MMEVAERLIKVQGELIDNQDKLIENQRKLIEVLKAEIAIYQKIVDKIKNKESEEKPNDRKRI